MSSGDELLRALAAGESALLAVDTIVGLHASAGLPSTAIRLRELKGSPPERPFLLLFASTEDAFRFGRPDPAHELALCSAWPGPLTALLRPTEAAPRAWWGPGGLLASRVPALASLRRLIGELGSPLWSTSANRAGEEPAADMDAARAQFPDLVWAVFGSGSADDLPSTLVDLSGQKARILRPGAAPWPPP